MPLSKRKKGVAAHGRVVAGGHRQSRAAFAVSRGAGRRANLAGRLRAAGQRQFTPLATSNSTSAVRKRSPRAVAGRIDKLFANETGQMVEAGDDLALLYSPDLMVTIQNLIDAKRRGDKQIC